MRVVSPITLRSTPADRRIAQAIYVALLCSLFVYAIVAGLFLRRQIPIRPLMEAVRSPLVLAIYGLAVMTFLLAGPISAQIARRSRARAGFVAGLALLESITIEGLVLGILAHDWRLVAPLWALSLIGFALSYPSEPGDPELMV